MGKQIIKQPNGKFCLFSSVVDSVTHYDMTEQEIVDVFVEDYRGTIQIKVNDTISKLDRGEEPYHIFTMDYTQMISHIKNVCGKEEANKVKMAIEGTQSPTIKTSTDTVEYVDKNEEYNEEVHITTKNIVSVSYKDTRSVAFLISGREYGNITDLEVARKCYDFFKYLFPTEKVTVEITYPHNHNKYTEIEVHTPIGLKTMQWSWENNVQM